MPTECYSGIAIPTLIPNECNGKYISTDCTLSPDANIILDLPSGASQTETNAALTTALVYKEQQIEDLQNSILTIDGSETKVEAGDNVTVTGIGTNLNPYVVNALSGGNQDLQSVLDNGGTFTSIDGLNYGVISSNGDALGDDIYTLIYQSNAFGSTLFQLFPTQSIISNQSSTSEGILDVTEGELVISQRVGDNTSYLKFKEPLIETELFFPSKSVMGSYTVNLTSDTVYTVATLPVGVLNDMVIVSDAIAPIYLGVLTGGGSVVCPVWHNGTIWVSR